MLEHPGGPTSYGWRSPQATDGLGASAAGGNRRTNVVTGLGGTVLGLIRTRADLHRWSAANAHGRQMHEAVNLLRQAAADDVAGLLPVVEKAIASAVRVVLRADDSSGIIGDAIRDLLALHAELARRRPPPAKLVTWLVKFQFDGTQDFFHIDIADYAPALKSKGLALYRPSSPRSRAGSRRS